jgi:hypothetical protein
MDETAISEENVVNMEIEDCIDEHIAANVDIFGGLSDDESFETVDELRKEISGLKEIIRLLKMIDQ